MMYLERNDSINKSLLLPVLTSTSMVYSHNMSSAIVSEYHDDHNYDGKSGVSETFVCYSILLLRRNPIARTVLCVCSVLYRISRVFLFFFSFVYVMVKILLMLKLRHDQTPSEKTRKSIKITIVLSFNLID